MDFGQRGRGLKCRHTLFRRAGTDPNLILLDDDATTRLFGAPGTDRCMERPTSASDLIFTRQ